MYCNRSVVKGCNRHSSSSSSPAHSAVPSRVIRTSTACRLAHSSRRRTVHVAAAAPAAAPPAAGFRVLVLNAGSSSLKFKTFNVGANDVLEPGLGGVFERIGDESQSCLLAKGTSATSNGQTMKWDIKVPAKDHVAAMQTILGFLKEHVSDNITREVMAVGHRVVHGLEINAPRELDPEVLDTIRRAAALAPLHNGAALQGIQAATEVFAGISQVGVFDTAFHATMPPTAFMYALPYELYEQHHIRRYGFHGTSHRYLVEEAARMLGKRTDQVNVITCHLGNGSSIAAVKNGVCVDTSMGMTPLEGLVMGTRCGDIDPAVVLYLQTQLGLSVKEADNLLNKKSGLLGLCGDNDLRSVIALSEQGEARGALALDMFVYRIRKYIGAYMVALGGQVDAIIFSAGIGENSAVVRRLVCKDLQHLGIELDEAKNKTGYGGKQLDISSDAARIRVLVIPTDEERSIAQQTLSVVASKQTKQ